MDAADYKALNNLYNKEFLLEGKQEDIEDLKKLHDNPDEAFAKKNYGSVEAYKKMLKRKIAIKDQQIGDDLISTISNLNDDEFQNWKSKSFFAKTPWSKSELLVKLKKSKKNREDVYSLNEAEQRPEDEEDAEEIIGDGPDSEGVDEPVDSTEDKSKNKKVPKKESKNINNLNKVKVMTEDKSIFDKLFEQVMGEAEDEDMELGIDIDGADDEGLGGEEDGDVTITLDKELATKLHEILMDVLGGEEEGDEEGDETGDLDDGFDEDSDPFEEENHQTNDGAKPGVDPSDGGGKTSEPAGDSLGGKSSGTGDGKATDQVGTKATSDGKKTGHDPSGLTSPGKKVVKK